MSRLPTPLVVGLLLVLAGVAVVRNVLFFTQTETPRAAEEGVTLDLGRSPAASGPVASGPAEARMATWLARATPPPPQRLRDPFHLVRRHQQVARTEGGPHLQGILVTQGRAAALVDGAPVVVGERVATGQVAQITPTGVRLTTPKGERWLEFQPWEVDVVADGGD